MIKKLILKLCKFFLSPTNYAKKVGVKIGVNCKLGTKEFGSEPYLISIGDNFYSSSNIQFVTHDGSVNVLRNIFPEHKNADFFGQIKIGNNVFIGYGCIILPNTIIEDNVVIGAGSVVKGKLLKNSVYAGVPARYICSINEYRNKIKANLFPTKGLNYTEKKKFIEKAIENID
ncbi:acyltransferase [Acinetobacter baumannii]|nr:acyltransferase [Acinetobacter baumannii]